jgi:hypothetical protein
MAMIEMQSLPEFQELHAHKDAAMDFTIVMATMPAADASGPPLTTPRPVAPRPRAVLARRPRAVCSNIEE